MKKINTKLIYRFFSIFLFFVVLFTISGCTSAGNSQAKDAYVPVRLVFWSVWDDEYAVQDLIAEYRKLRPNVTIEYRKLRYEEYEREILEALADDRGPDIMSIHNTWMERYQERLKPLPTQTVIPIKYITGSIKKEELYDFQVSNSLTPLDLKRQFLDVVSSDVVMNYTDATTGAQKTGVFGLPMSVDTLVMFYNKDLLKNAGIIEPPTNWVDFQEAVKKITKIDSNTGDILISGTSLGTASNVPRNFDILSLLMMQNRTPMLNDRGNATFNANLSDGGGVPAIGALEYYTQFASPLYETYCWNDKMPNALDAFIQGQTAFFFGYSYDRDTIDAQTKINYDIAPVPQLGDNQKVNYASYWVDTVSNKSKNSDYAWDFIQFITREENVVNYLDRNKKPTALKSTAIINKQLADEKLYVFADQLFTATSWYKGKNSTGAEEAFAEMINLVLKGELEPQKALKQAVDKVNSSIRGN